MRKIYLLLSVLICNLTFLQVKAQNEVANFNFTATGNNVHFTNTSNTNPADTAMRRCLWLFGDGSSLLTHYSTNPAKTYSQYGNYQACLKLYRIIPGTTSPGDSLALISSSCKPITLTAPDSCSARFEMISVASNSLNKYFIAQPWHNNQKKPERICWSFGDGRDTCIDYNPNQPPPNGYAAFHFYNQPGTYVVCIKILYQGGCEAHFCKTLLIGEQVACGAGIEVNRTGVSPLGKTFTAIPSHSQNKRPVRICWNFGDNRDTCINYSTAYPGPYSVFHNYTNPGNYNVCIKINYDGGCEAYKCESVQVSSADSCKASFEIVSTASNPRGKYFIAQPWHNNQKKPERICWNFGDGRDTCIDYNPNQPPPNAYAVFHNYIQPGTYVVCVKILYQGGCEAHLCKTLLVEQQTATCTANFEVSPNISTSLGRKFTAINTHSQNKKPIKICWNFGDNTDTCIYYPVSFTGPYSVNHNYINPGNYNVCIKIFYDEGCVAEYCKLVEVNMPANCSAEIQTGSTPSSILSRQFTAIPSHSTQNKPVYICWNFGDNRDTCIQYSNTFTGPYLVNHTYALPGQYNVCVRIVYTGGCEAKKCQLIQVNTPDSCKADFERLPVTTATPLTASFKALQGHNSNKKPIRICWKFGDNRDTCINYSESYAGAYTVTHTYIQPGNYEVCVKILYAGGCEAIKCKPVVITHPETCKASINQVTSTISSLTRGLYVVAASSTNRRIERICWNFGDGSDTCFIPATTTPLQIYSVNHTYPGPGVYRACVKILFAGGCVAEACTEIVIRSTNGICGGYFTDSLSAPRTISFRGFGIHNPGDKVSSYRWSFGDGSNATGQNVVHTYNQPGIYNVCLQIITEKGCETRICKKVLFFGNTPPVLQLSPNPVINILHSVFFSTHTETVTIRIINSSGNIVKTFTRNVTSGVNVWDFNLSDLLPGIYSFIVQSPNQLASGLLIKQ